MADDLDLGTFGSDGLEDIGDVFEAVALLAGLGEVDVDDDAERVSGGGRGG